MREHGRAAIAAVSFLTAVPLGRRVVLTERDLRRGVVLFPIVGGAVGLLVAGVAWSAATILPAFAAAVLGVAAGVAVTAAFHLDGLGDVADGIGASLGGRDPLPAMLDPRLGTFGLAAIALDLLLKVSLVAAFADGGFAWAIPAAAAIARVAPIGLAWRLPYVGSGTGGWIADVGARTAGAALVVAVAIAVPTVGPAAAGVLAVAAAVPAAALGPWSRGHLGGVTGDVFGASAELGETLALAAAVALA